VLPLLAGCAFGKIAGDDDFETPHDSGIVKADAGVKDAKTIPEATTVEDSSQTLPDVTTTETCTTLPLGTGDPQCDTCIASSCCDEDQTCGNDQDCMAFVGCVDECVPDDGGPPDQECYSECEADYSTGEAELDALDTCLENDCSTACGE
jgi:hypothetical protein